MASDGDIQSRLIGVLRDAALRLDTAGLPRSLVMEMERLSEQVRQPCRIAVVGEVKAGKSSFINALLGHDLAKTGTLETTATINYFMHGPMDPERPVTCVWSDGKTTAETADFLDRLQGNDLETLQRAEGIKHLEYHLPDPYLERVTIIDTPGMGAVVEEHGERTAEFLSLQGRLRERHDRETRELGSDADAVLYLLGSVARANDRDFLERFRQRTSGQTRAHNAIGVLAKIDLQPQLLEQREERARELGEQLGANLNTVIPVSAGIRRALDRLQENDGAGLLQMMTLFRSMEPNTMRKALTFEDVYLDPHLSCALPAEDREALLDGMAWTVFTTIARVAANPELDPEAVAAHLEELAGFRRLHELLNRHFIKRGQYLRGYRILSDARAIVNEVKYRYAREYQQRQREQTARRERLLRFIREADGDSSVARELEDMVIGAIGTTEDLRPAVDDLERLFGRIFLELEAYNADYEALLQIEDDGTELSAAELDELRPLLGLYGMDTAQRLRGHSSVKHAEERQQYWYEVQQYDSRAARRAVAERAVARYGMILDELIAG